MPPAASCSLHTHRLLRLPRNLPAAVHGRGRALGRGAAALPRGEPRGPGRQRRRRAAALLHKSVGLQGRRPGSRVLGGWPLLSCPFHAWAQWSMCRRAACTAAAWHSSIGSPLGWQSQCPFTPLSLAPARPAMCAAQVLGFRRLPRPDLGFPGHWLQGPGGVMLHIIRESRAGRGRAAVEPDRAVPTCRPNLAAAAPAGLPAQRATPPCRAASPTGRRGAGVGRQRWAAARHMGGGKQQARPECPAESAAAASAGREARLSSMLRLPPSPPPLRAGGVRRPARGLVHPARLAHRAGGGEVGGAGVCLLAGGARGEGELQRARGRQGTPAGRERRPAAARQPPALPCCCTSSPCTPRPARRWRTLRRRRRACARTAWSTAASCCRVRRWAGGLRSGSPLAGGPPTRAPMHPCGPPTCPPAHPPALPPQTWTCASSSSGTPKVGRPLLGPQRLRCWPAKPARPPPAAYPATHCRQRRGGGAVRRHPPLPAGAGRGAAGLGPGQAAAQARRQPTSPSSGCRSCCVHRVPPCPVLPVSSCSALCAA